MIPFVGVGLKVALGAFVVALVGVVALRIQTGSRRQTRRKARGYARAATSAVVFGVVGVASVFLGLFDASADALGGGLNVAIGNPEILTNGLLAGLGYLWASDMVAAGAYSFALAAGVVILVGIGLSRT